MNFKVTLSLLHSFPVMYNNTWGLRVEEDTEKVEEPEKTVVIAVCYTITNCAPLFQRMVEVSFLKFKKPFSKCEKREPL